MLQVLQMEKNKTNLQRAKTNLLDLKANKVDFQWEAHIQTNKCHQFFF